MFPLWLALLSGLRWDSCDEEAFGESVCLDKLFLHLTCMIDIIIESIKNIIRLFMSNIRFECQIIFGLRLCL